MIGLLLSLAGASELASYAQLDVDTEGLAVTLAGTSVVGQRAYLYTGITWQDGLNPLGLGTGIGRPHADVGVVAELGALHVLTLVGAGWDGWTSAPLVVGRVRSLADGIEYELLLERNHLEEHCRPPRSSKLSW